MRYPGPHLPQPLFLYKKCWFALSTSVVYDLDCPPGLQLPLVSLLVSRGEEVSTGAQAALSALPSVGTAAAWRGAEDPEEGWNLPRSSLALVLWT